MELTACHGKRRNSVQSIWGLIDASPDFLHQRCDAGQSGEHPTEFSPLDAKLFDAQGVEVAASLNAFERFPRIFADPCIFQVAAPRNAALD